MELATGNCGLSGRRFRGCWREEFRERIDYEGYQQWLPASIHQGQIVPSRVGDARARLMLDLASFHDNISTRRGLYCRNYGLWMGGDIRPWCRPTTRRAGVKRFSLAHSTQ